MCRLQPAPLLLFAWVVALLPQATQGRRPASAPRPVAETFIAALAVIAAVRAGWLPLWLLEQRW